MIRLAIVGCGPWGAHHIRVFGNLPNSQVVAAADPAENRREEISKRFPRLPIEKNPERLFQDPSVDAAVIATPTATHHSLVRQALLAGKHVLCEKPLCENSAQAQELLRLARSARRVLMTGHVFLFNAGIVKMKALLQSGELGKPRYLSAIRTNLGPIRSDVNASYDLASHDVAIFNWLLESEPERVSATGACFLRDDLEDVVSLSLRYPGNVFANILASWLNPKKVRQITLVGTQRMASWDDLELNMPIAVYDCGAPSVSLQGNYGEFLRTAMWTGDVRMPKIQLEEPLQAQNRHFLEAVEGGTPLDRADARFAAGVVRALEAAAESLKSGGMPTPPKPNGDPAGG